MINIWTINCNELNKIINGLKVKFKYTYINNNKQT